MPTYTGLSVFSDLLLVRGAFWGNGLAASCTLQTPLSGGRSCIIRTGAEPYSLNYRIPSRRVLLESRASGRDCLKTTGYGLTALPSNASLLRRQTPRRSSTVFRSPSQPAVVADPGK